MMQFYLMREGLRQFYGKNARFIMPLLRFATALTALVLMDIQMGWMGALGSIPVMLALALVCALLPWAGTTLILGGCLLGHFAAASLEVVILAAVLFFFIWILHMVFLPEGGLALVFVPLLFSLRIPYLAPLLLALSGTATGVIPVVSGVVVYYFIRTAADSMSVLTSGAALTILQRFTQCLTSLKDNRVMYIMVVAFAATYFTVYLIRQLTADYSRMVGIITGMLVNALVLLLGELWFPVDARELSIFSILPGTLVSGLLALAVDFFFFAVDYHRTEYVQFEDDDYYYYVKAVPKIVVTAPDKQVKKISSRTEPEYRRGVESPGRRSRNGYLDDRR